MLAKLRNRLTYANVGVTIALVLGTTGIGIAAIPGSGGLINACYEKRSGSIRVVDERKKCRRGERKLSWNQRGVPGERGAPGESGAPGQPGAQGERGPEGPPNPNASNSDRLDNLDSSDFMRSNAAAGGDLTGSYPSPQVGPDAIESAEVRDSSLRLTDIAQVHHIDQADFDPVSPWSCSFRNFFTVGAQVGDNVLVFAPDTLPVGLMVQGMRITTNAIQWRICNVTGAEIDPPALAYRFVVLR